MATPYATGAVHIYVKLPPAAPGLGGQTKYLGTSEQGPTRQTDRTFKQVMNDLSSQKPFDYIYAGGEEAILSFNLTRWNDNVAQALEAAPVSGGVGFSTIFDQGTVMGREGRALEIWYAYTFGGIPGSALRPSFVGQEGGRHYLQGLFWGPEQDELGTKERKKHMVFKCWKKFDVSQTPARFTLFDFNMAGLPAID